MGRPEDERIPKGQKVKSEAIRRVKETFDEAGIIMPEPIYKVRLEHLETEKLQDKPKVLQPESNESADVEPERHLENLIDDERESIRPDLLEEGGVVG